MTLVVSCTGFGATTRVGSGVDSLEKQACSSSHFRSQARISSAFSSEQVHRDNESAGIIRRGRCEPKLRVVLILFQRGFQVLTRLSRQIYPFMTTFGTIEMSHQKVISVPNSIRANSQLVVDMAIVPILLDICVGGEDEVQEITKRVRRSLPSPCI
jgi:hypothetical protein